MASLNWVLLQPGSLLPVPLPEERPLLTLTDIVIAINPLHSPLSTTSSSSNTTSPSASSSTPTTSGSTGFIQSSLSTLAPIASSSVNTVKSYLLPAADTRTSVAGKIYLSTLRIVFVAQTARGPGGTGGVDGYGLGPEEANSIQTLSVPFTHFLDGKFVQPWFGATYYEGKAWPARGGGLEAPYQVTYHFKNAGGFKFYQIVEEMKNRITVGRPSAVYEEPPPVYVHEQLSLPPPPSAPPSIPLSEDAPPGYDVPTYSPPPFPPPRP